MVSFCLIFLLLASSAIASESSLELLTKLEEKRLSLLNSLENTKSSLQQIKSEMQSVRIEYENLKTYSDARDKLLNEKERLLEQREQLLRKQKADYEEQKKGLEKRLVLLISQLEQAKRWESLYSGLESSFEDYKKANRGARIRTGVICFGIGAVLAGVIVSVLRK